MQITESTLHGLHVALDHIKTEMVNKELQQERHKHELLQKLISADKLDQEFEEESKQLDAEITSIKQNISEVDKEL